MTPIKKTKEGKTVKDAVKEKKVIVKKKPGHSSRPLVTVPVEPVVVHADGAFIRALGRRKTASARVRLYSGGSGTMTINGKPLSVYLPTASLRNVVMSPFAATGLQEAFNTAVKVAGGGAEGQAQAIRHGISRALVIYNQDLRKALKALGFLKRDPREKERKKFGLKGARRAPQWAKR